MLFKGELPKRAVYTPQELVQQVGVILYGLGKQPTGNWSASVNLEIEFSIKKKWNNWVIRYAEQSQEPLFYLSFTERYSWISFFPHFKFFFVYFLCVFIWGYSFSSGLFPAPLMTYCGFLEIIDSTSNFELAIYSCFFLKWDLFCH